MKCTNCGNENPTDARFCTYCGQKLDSATRACPWCHATIANQAAFCPKCGQNATAIVFSPKDSGELKSLFRKAGCPVEYPRDMLRALNLKQGEEVISAIPKGRGGLFGAIDRGNNCFSDFSVNGVIRYQGLFSAVVTNNRLIMTEPNMEIAFESLKGFKFVSQLDEGRPKVTLNQEDREFSFLLALTIGTGSMGTAFRMANISYGLFDSDQADKVDHNSTKAFAFIDAIDELLSTIADVWAQRNQL